MSGTSTEQLEATCRSIKDDIEFLQGLTEDYFLLDEESLPPKKFARLKDLLETWDPDVWFGYCETALAIDCLARIHISDGRLMPAKQMHLNSVRCVLGTGGPHIELVADCNNERLEVRGYWSRDACTLQINADGMLQHLFQYGDEMLAIS